MKVFEKNGMVYIEIDKREYKNVVSNILICDESVRERMLQAESLVIDVKDNEEDFMEVCRKLVTRGK